MTKRNGHGWIIWNMANIISSFRFLTPIFLFTTEWTIEMKLISYLILFATDAIDGPIARLVKNNKGVGKFIDSFADKIMHGSGLIFLFNEELIERFIPVTVLLGEIVIVIPILYGIYLFIKKEIWESKIKSPRIIYPGVLKELEEIMNVNALGKVKMIAYAIGAGFIFLNIVKPSDLFRYGYIIMFGAGIIFCAGAMYDYYKEYLEWQKKFFKN